MKAITPLFVSFFLLSLLSTTEAQVLVGPVAGGQYSWTNFDDKELKDIYKVKPVPGFHAGVGLSFLVRKRFFLHGAFLYSTKGKVIEGKEDKLLRNKVRYRFIDVPILYTVDFKARLGGNKEFKYYLGLGPNISYWLGGKGEIYTTDFSELGEVEPRKYTIAFNKSPEEVTDGEMSVQDPNRIQLGLNIGGGFEFEPAGFSKIMFTVRYEFGHSFFSKTTDGVFQDTYYNDILRSRNQGFRVSLSYLFDLRVEDRKRGKSTIKRKNI
jgi:hypothetical protein